MKVRAIFPGTFDPIHYGHIDIATRATRIFDQVVIAVYDRPLKNLLFSPDERLSLVSDSFSDVKGIKVCGYSGMTVEFCRKMNAKVIVRGLRVFSDFEAEFRMALANHRLAPDIEVVALITNEEHTFLSSSTVREIVSLGGDVTSMVPGHVKKALLKKFKDFDDGEYYPVQSLRD
ncbi:MAG: pantetheine-phosphate adenylyltransferase [Anaerolineaceae bacterium]|nr:pantetheine-phosphate adenylyltransferase [Anaerolineaceae bacterium]